jgi:hypothetical protein
MSRKYLKNSHYFLHFLLDANCTKQQRRSILQNLSKYQLQSIIEILYNLFQNKNIKYSPNLVKVLKQHQKSFDKILSSKRYSKIREFIKKHYRLIYIILSKAKPLITQVLDS